MEARTRRKGPYPNLDATQVFGSRFKQRDRIAEEPDTRIASRTKQSSHLPGRVVVIDDEFPLGTAADGARAILSVNQTTLFLASQPVLPFAVLYPSLRLHCARAPSTGALQ